MIYGRYCKKCNLAFEIELPLKEYDKEVPCCKCKGETNRVVISKPVKHFSWSSWNVLDNDK